MKVVFPQLYLFTQYVLYVSIVFEQITFVLFGALFVASWKLQIFHLTLAGCKQSLFVLFSFYMENIFLW